MCRLQNIAMRDYQESVTTRQTDAGQSDPYVPLCFAGNTKSKPMSLVELYSNHQHLAS